MLRDLIHTSTQDADKLDKVLGDQQLKKLLGYAVYKRDSVIES